MRTTRRVALPAAVVACLLAVLLAPAPAAATPTDTPVGGVETPATLSTVDQGGPLADLVARCDLSATDIAPGESVTLDASASQDADAYRYDRLGTGEFGDLVERSTRTVTYQEAGTYEPQVRAVNVTTDATDLAACGTLTVAENQRPTADFSYSPTDPAPEEAVSFSADATDSDGEVVEYLWRVDGEPVAERPDFEYAFPGPGEYTVELTATDDDGAQSTTKQVVSVSESNQAPTVDFSYSPTEPAPEEAVSFSAEASDTDGEAAGYVWRIDGEAVAEGPSFEYAFPGPGEYTVELTVTDNDGATDTATRTVTVTDSTTDGNGAGAPSSSFDTDDEGWRITGDAQGDGTAPDYLDSGGNPGGHICADDNVAGGTWYFSAPATFLGDRTAAYGGTLAFDIKQSSTDEQFAQDDIVLRNGTTTIVYDFGNATAHPGTDWTGYSVSLEATDSGWTYDSGGDVSPAAFRTLLGNLTSLSIRGEYVSGSDRGCLDNVRLSQPASTEPPTADFAFDPSTPAPDETVAFEATASDDDGEVTAYQWRVDGELVAEGPSFEYAFPGPGEYTVELTVTDDDGATDSVSKTVSVAEGNQTPTVELELSPVAPAPGEDVALVAEATDPDGEVVAYRWTVDDRTVGERPELTYAFEDPGTYLVAVTVTDDDGETASASREVTVEGDEAPPTATPTPTDAATPTPTSAGDITLSAAWWHSPTAPLRGEPVTLVASGPADSAVTYRWDVDDDGSYETQGALASHVFTTTGDHAVTLQATLPDGSTETTTETVAVADETVSQPGTADTILWHAPVNPRPDETVTLVADVAADDVAGYRWDVDGDGQTDASGEVATYSYPTEGRYTVDLTVEYSNGSTATGTRTVVVGDVPERTATTTVTPPGTAARTTTAGGTTSDRPGEGTTGGGSPGFGLTAGLAAVALLAARLVAGRRGRP